MRNGEAKTWETVNVDKTNEAVARMASNEINLKVLPLNIQQSRQQIKIAEKPRIASRARECNHLQSRAA